MPYFTENVVYKSDIAQSVQDLYRAVLNDAPLLEKEENLFFLLDQILREYASDFESADVLRPNRQIQSLCQYMEEHFAENVTLDELLSMTDFGKSICFVPLPGRPGCRLTGIFRRSGWTRRSASWKKGLRLLMRQGWPDFRIRAILPTFLRSLSG